MKKLNPINLSLTILLVYTTISLLTYFTSFGINPANSFYSFFTLPESLASVIYLFLSDDYPEIDVFYVIILLSLFISLWLIILTLTRGLSNNSNQVRKTK